MSPAQFTAFSIMCALFVAFPARSTEPCSRLLCENVLIFLEQNWVLAMQKNDAKTLSAILANTYVDTDETGHRGDKASVMSALSSGTLKFSSIHLSDMKVSIYGDAGVVTGVGVQLGTYKGQPVAERVVFTDTFVRDGETWVAVASQRTVAPK